MTDTDWSYGFIIQAYASILDHALVQMPVPYWWRFLFQTVPQATLTCWAILDGEVSDHPTVFSYTQDFRHWVKKERAWRALMRRQTPWPYPLGSESPLEFGRKEQMAESMMENIKKDFLGDLSACILTYGILTREQDVLAQEQYCSRLPSKEGWLEGSTTW